MIDIFADDNAELLGDEVSIAEAIALTCNLAKHLKKPSLCVRFADNDEVQQLNAQWRDKDKVTDVLSFPMLDAAELAALEDNNEEFLGDIILAEPFVREEAKRLHLSPEHHALHLIVHGTLHLLGFDHIDDDEAEVMQQLENKVMLQLDLHQPYSFTSIDEKIVGNT